MEDFKLWYVTMYPTIPSTVDSEGPWCLSSTGCCTTCESLKIHNPEKKINFPHYGWKEVLLSKSHVVMMIILLTFLLINVNFLEHHPHCLSLVQWVEASFLVLIFKLKSRMTKQNRGEVQDGDRTSLSNVAWQCPRLWVHSGNSADSPSIQHLVDLTSQLGRTKLRPLPSIPKGKSHRETSFPPPLGLTISWQMNFTFHSKALTEKWFFVFVFLLQSP